MVSQLKTLYDELIRAFTARPSDLKKCTLLLGKLKVNLEWPSIDHHSFAAQIFLIEAGLLLPQGDANLGDLVFTRS